MTGTRGFDRRGMTLMEVMIAVIVMAVVAALAIPSYRQTVEKARSSEATTNLNIILMGEKLYKIDNGTFAAAMACTSTGVPTTCTAINTALNTDITAEFYNLNVGAGTKVAFSATATRRGGTKTFTIDQTGTITSAGTF
jgi:prepilin-type N-terminal cleavage/methylation domain-containing protein